MGGGGGGTRFGGTYGALYAAAGNVVTDAGGGSPAQGQTLLVRRNPDIPLGLEFNNPTNLRPSNPRNPWQGQTGIYRETPRSVGFLGFDSADNGLRAGAINIVSKQVRHDRNTVAEIVHDWAPSSDRNDPNAYARRVARALGVDPNERIDTRNAATLTGLLNAIVWEETGARFPAQQIEQAVNAAITHHDTR